MSNRMICYVRLCIGAGTIMLGLTASTLTAYAEGVLPSYAHSKRESNEETLHGRIASISGKFRLEFQDDRGFIDVVELHHGTIINPTGLELTPGMSSTILGHPQGRVFIANEIDTPYTVSYTSSPNYMPYVYPIGSNWSSPWEWNALYAPGFGGYGWYGTGSVGGGNNTSWHGNGGLRRTL